MDFSSDDIGLVSKKKHLFIWTSKESDKDN